jgi:hypothetical protein
MFVVPIVRRPSPTAGVCTAIGQKKKKKIVGNRQATVGKFL